MDSISKGLKRYYKSVEYQKRIQLHNQHKTNSILKILQTEPLSTLELTKKYNQSTNKDITLRRMRQLLYELLEQKLVDTKIVNTSGKKGRYRVWSLRQKNN